jgi:hypothetical protein
MERSTLMRMSANPGARLIAVVVITDTSAYLAEHRDFDVLTNRTTDRATPTG